MRQTQAVWLRDLGSLGRYLPFPALFLPLWSCDDNKIHFVDTQKARKRTKCLSPWFVSFRFLWWKPNPPCVYYRCLEIETLRVNGSCRLCPHEWVNLLMDLRVIVLGSLIYLANDIWRWLALNVIFSDMWSNENWGWGGGCVCALSLSLSFPTQRMLNEWLITEACQEGKSILMKWLGRKFIATFYIIHYGILRFLGMC